MADHFREIIHLRISGLEQRVDAEADAVKEHFDELRKFITDGFNHQAAEFRAELSAGLRAVRAELAEGLQAVRAELGEDLTTVRAELGEGLQALRADLAEGLTTVRAEMGREGDRLEQKLDGYQEATRREFGGLEDKIDAHHDAIHLVLQDILRRLPSALPSEL